MVQEIDGFEIIEHDNNDMINWRDAEIRIIEQDVNDLHDIMAELNRVVGEQGIQLNHAADNIDNAKENAAKAAKNLKQTKKGTTKTLKCLFKIGAVVVVLLVGIVAILM